MTATGPARELLDTPLAAVQTFLPFADFELSARTLDLKRLGKQRVEVIQVVRALTTPGYGWASHPAVLMWSGFEQALGCYGLTSCRVWTESGFADTCAATISHDLELFGIDAVPGQDDLDDDAVPPWLGDEAFHRSHRAALVRKDPERYGPLFPCIPADLPYVWPVRSPRVLAAEESKVRNALVREERAVARAQDEAARQRRRRSRAAKRGWQTRRSGSGPAA